MSVSARPTRTRERVVGWASLSGATALLVVLGLLTAPVWLQNQYHLHIAIQAVIFAILAMSLNLLLGYTGQLSLGHAAFFGMGGYTSALLNRHFGWPVAVGFVAAILTSALAGFLVGKLSLRLRGAYFVLVSLSFAGVTWLVSMNWMELTNGPLGMPGIPVPEVAIPGLGGFAFVSKPAYYYLALVVAMAAYYVCHRLVTSRFGRACIALRENEVLAQAVGIDGTYFLVVTAVVSAAMAGAAGSLYVHYTRLVSPEIFLFSYTVTAVIMVVAGGKGTLLGPLVGAALFTALPEVLRALTSYQWQLLIYGIVLIVVIFFLPKGIVPAAASWGRRLAPAVRKPGPDQPSMSVRANSKQRV